MFAIALTVSLLLGGSQSSADRGYGHVDFANSGAPAAQADFLDITASPWPTGARR